MGPTLNRENALPLKGNPGIPFVFIARLPMDGLVIAGPDRAAAQAFSLPAFGLVKAGPGPDAGARS